MHIKYASLTPNRQCCTICPFISGFLVGFLAIFAMLSCEFDSRVKWPSFVWNEDPRLLLPCPPEHPKYDIADFIPKMDRNSSLEMNQEDNSTSVANLEFHLGSEEEVHSFEDHAFKNLLYDEVQVLCMVMTIPKNHQKTALAVKKTWGSRCNKVIFMSGQNDSDLGAVDLSVPEGSSYQWGKTKAAFKYAYEYHLEDYDWFLKAEDNSYVVVENLRLLLYPYSPDYPIYFGHKFKPYVDQGYMSGGASYVLSKESLRRFIEKALPDPQKCDPGNSGKRNSEDVQMGICLENVNVLPVDSREPNGRQRFFPYTPEHHLIPGFLKPKDPFWSYSFYPVKEGFECCADSAISFHSIPQNQLYIFDYLIYHLRPYGIVFLPQSLPEKLTFDEIVEQYNEAHAERNLTYQIDNDTQENSQK